MATKSETPLQSLTVFLLREGVNRADEALRDPRSLKCLEICSDASRGLSLIRRPPRQETIEGIDAADHLPGKLQSL
jgi:hypothetical protein